MSNKLLGKTETIIKPKTKEDKKKKIKHDPRKHKVKSVKATSLGE